jgi:acetolactate synthase I/II/III large subunit
VSDGYKIGDLVAEFLSLCEVGTAFGIVSVHNIPILDAIGRRNRIRFVMARSEVGAGHMTDGFSRASGGLGVLVSSTGPGAANAVPGLLEARFAGTPLLHLTGQTATRFADRDTGMVHDAPDQLGMLRSVSKRAYRIRTPQEALGILTRAAVEALTPPRGPVSVEIPIDIQNAEIDRPAIFDDFALPLSSPRIPTDADIDRLVEAVLAAKRPMLWLGRGAHAASAPARRLANAGFGVVTSWGGRGTIPEDHPMTLGALRGYGVPVVEEFYRGVDLMLVVGSKLRGHETGEFRLKLPETIIHVDVDPLADGRTYANKLFICGDSAETLIRLEERVRDKLDLDPAFGADFIAMKAAAQSAFRDTLGPYADFPAQLRKVMPRDALWVRDITISNSTWGNKLFPVFDPRDSIHPASAGIGEGLCLGLGAAVAAGARKTVVMTGDGGFFFNMSELWTAVQERLNIVIIVMNDNGYGVIKQIQDVVTGGRRFYGDLAAPDLKEVAALARMPFRKVEKVDEFGNKVAEALALDGPSLVEVAMTSIGAHPPYFPFAPKRGADTR